jgi:hypothetical protein
MLVLGCLSNEIISIVKEKGFGIEYPDAYLAVESQSGTARLPDHRGTDFRWPPQAAPLRKT